MKILLLVAISLGIPSVCSAHSGAVINSVVNYLPILAPIAAAGGISGIIKFIRSLFKNDNHDKKNNH